MSPKFATKYQPGDKVAMGPVHTFAGAEYEEAPEGAIGKITGVNEGKEGRETYYSIRWEKGTKRKNKTSQSDLETSYVDESCLQPEALPLSEEELAEVYEMLGVKPKHLPLIEGYKANAEDCPACDVTKMAYPFICPGPGSE